MLNLYIKKLRFIRLFNFFFLIFDVFRFEPKIQKYHSSEFTQFFFCHHSITFFIIRYGIRFFGFGFRSIYSHVFVAKTTNQVWKNFGLRKIIKNLFGHG